MHLGPENALQAVAHLDPEVFLPIHWGTFRLAMHAWDQPAEVLYQNASKYRTRLIMPKLGELVEPARVSDSLEPWWRSVDRTREPGRLPVAEPAAIRLEHTMPWPLD